MGQCNDGQAVGQFCYEEEVGGWRKERTVETPVPLYLRRFPANHSSLITNPSSLSTSNIRRGASLCFLRVVRASVVGSSFGVWQGPVSG